MQALDYVIKYQELFDKCYNFTNLYIYIEFDYNRYKIIITTQDYIDQIFVDLNMIKNENIILLIVKKRLYRLINKKEKTNE